MPSNNDSGVATAFFQASAAGELAACRAARERINDALIAAAGGEVTTITVGRQEPTPVLKD